MVNYLLHFFNHSSIACFSQKFFQTSIRRSILCFLILCIIITGVRFDSNFEGITSFRIQLTVFGIKSTANISCVARIYILGRQANRSSTSPYYPPTLHFYSNLDLSSLPHCIMLQHRQNNAINKLLVAVFYGAVAEILLPCKCRKHKAGCLLWLIFRPHFNWTLRSEKLALNELFGTRRKYWYGIY